MSLIGRLVQTARLGSPVAEDLAADLSFSPDFVRSWFEADPPIIDSWVSAVADTLSPPDDFDRPEILPVGFESKLIPEPDPIICPPGDVSLFLDPDPVEAALASFSDGRGSHRMLLEPRGVDWII